METYNAYVIHRGEQSCGCSRTRKEYLYDSTGFYKMEFYSREEADDAAFRQMMKKDGDSYRVTKAR